MGLFACERHGHQFLGSMGRHVLDACRADRPMVVVSVPWVAEIGICHDCKRALEQVLATTVDTNVVFRATADVAQPRCPACMVEWHERHELRPEPWAVDLLGPLA